MDRRVLIPRPDTESLVDVALARTESRSLSMRALDLCTGSGCVAITLARQRPTSSVHATDLSEDALAVARENALRLGAYNVSFTRGDLFDALPPDCGPFDVIVANPPYIATARSETSSATSRTSSRASRSTAAPTGWRSSRIVEAAPARLAPGGLLAIEVGAGEARDAVAIFEARGFVDVIASRDYGRVERVVNGMWHLKCVQGMSMTAAPRTSAGRRARPRVLGSILR